MAAIVPSDRTILDLLRQRERMTVAEFELELGVTATAVRQRLNRLLDKGYLERHKDDEATGRGRPSHWYQLTEEGRRRTGSNFGDLARVLWEELRAIPDEAVRRGLLQRIADRLAALYRDQVQAESVDGRLQNLADLFEQRQLPFQVGTTSSGPSEGGEATVARPTLTALACPYPELAELDRSLCALERLVFSQLIGQRMTLTDCRLDGGACCTFQVQPLTQIESAFRGNVVASDVPAKASGDVTGVV
ncbi:MAG: MarR family transcriptional regulator [Planctomycetales bacterium]|nr:MarR family transcriptional regulator [Planctomycetales bacterium]